MKKLLLIVGLGLSTLSYGQKINSLGNTVEVKKGPVIMLSGAAFITAGLLTPPTMVGGSTTEKKPFHQQIRNLPILTGVCVITVGIGFAIGGK